MIQNLLKRSLQKYKLKNSYISYNKYFQIKLKVLIMKITLRAIDQNKVPEVPAISGTNNLKAETKNDVLNYIELDSNFAYIMTYLKDIKELTDALQGTSEFASIKTQLNSLNTKINDLLNTIDKTKDIDKPVSTAQQAALDLKLDKDNIKTINSKSIVGTGNIEIALTDQELKSKLSTLGNFEQGTYGIFATATPTSHNQIMPGTSLMNSDGTNPSGTWRQCGAIDNDKAIFFRII